MKYLLVAHRMDREWEARRLVNGAIAIIHAWINVFGLDKRNTNSRCQWYFKGWVGKIWRNDWLEEWRKGCQKTAEVWARVTKNSHRNRGGLIERDEIMLKACLSQTLSWWSQLRSLCPLNFCLDCINSPTRWYTNNSILKKQVQLWVPWDRFIWWPSVNTEYSNGSSHVSLFTSYPNSAGSVEALNLPAQFSHFSSGGYICLIQARPQSEQLLQGLSTADTSVYVWATLVSEQSTTGMQRVLIPFIPAFSINQSELVLSHKQDIGEIRVLGVDRVLEKLEVC